MNRKELLEKIEKFDIAFDFSEDKKEIYVGGGCGYCGGYGSRNEETFTLEQLKLIVNYMEMEGE